MASNSQKSLLVIIGIVFICAVTIFGHILFKAHREYQIFAQREKTLIKEFHATQQQVVLKQQYLERLKYQPDFFEWVIRQQLGYAKPSEIIYRFDSIPVEPDKR
ncbi:MAG: hypothetical protein A2007_01215 [Verrucomicrobia bacterium GWC2_42_7]|nr:MAG: hypothetical protein A2007_01215 [Verrucomicrobia bacterium GWC2_42_7]